MLPSRLRLTRGTLLRMVADAIMIHLALLAALLLRFFYVVLFQQYEANPDLGALMGGVVSEFSRTGWPLTLICLSFFYLSGFYTYGRAYQSRYKALVIAQAVSQSYLLFAFASYFFNNGQLTVSRGALVLAWILTLCVLIASRIWTRLWMTLIHPEREAEVRRTLGKGRRVLVIGGAGYIGSALLPKLLEKGYQVRLLDQLVFGEEPISGILNHPRLEVLRGDFRHVEKVVEALQGVDAVIHLGAIVGDPACNIDEELTIDVNLSATRMIAELAKTFGVRRMIFASTCSVYGASNQILDERSVVKPISLYGHTKLASEKLLLGMTCDTFAPTIVRFATIYGLSGRTRFDLVVNVLAAKAKTEGIIPVFGGGQWRPFVHVDDSAQAVSLILDAPLASVEGQVFNVGSDEQNYTIRQIGEIVHQQVISAELLIDETDADLRNYRVSFKKIRNQLGFKPRWTVEQGVQQVLEAISNGDVVDYTAAKYSNVKFLSEAGTRSFSHSNWARELLNEITSEGTG